MKAKDAPILQEKKQKSLECWTNCLGFTEKGYKHPYKNLFCGAAKFCLIYVGNLSFKANSKDIQQSFQKKMPVLWLLGVLKEKVAVVHLLQYNGKNLMTAIL